ncbi:STAS domain-containing protein [Streptomyces sp. NPDC050529]|uniref:STAS domain-containing protein n=1 Tax=unclassified Streptomyces TaxID=2593676 RepID=UPI002DDC4DC9|nr:MULTISPECIES: STAS domain-containing protein [unclassified Streptomyces]WRZ87574.1 STAS domain-containing protein [Streptomyces sp. NBC_01022]
MTFEAYLGCSGQTASIHLSGELTDNRVGALRALLGQAAARPVSRVVLRMEGLLSMTAGGVRALAVTRQGLPPGTELIIVGARQDVLGVLRSGGLDAAVTTTDPQAFAEAPRPAIPTFDSFPERTLL